MDSHIAAKVIAMVIQKDLEQKRKAEMSL